jgi:hypothetical protein
MHAEQALSDLRLTMRQRALRQPAQDFRYLRLALERRFVSKQRTTPRFRTVARSLSTLWAVARSLILDAPVVATLPQQKNRPNEAISSHVSITERRIPLARTLILTPTIKKTPDSSRCTQPIRTSIGESLQILKLHVAAVDGPSSFRSSLLAHYPNYYALN